MSDISARHRCRNRSTVGGLVMDRAGPVKTVTSRTKRIVTARDKVCVYCDSAEGPFHFDHRLARSRGGCSCPENIALACVPCNLTKSDRDVTEFRRNG